MKLGVVGYRNFHDYAFVKTMLDDFVLCYGKPEMIYSGGCRGTDKLAIRWAKDNNLPTHEFLPKGTQRKDFLNRNSEIVEASDVIIAFVSPESRGTWDTINKAKKLQKCCFTIKI